MKINSSPLFFFFLLILPAMVFAQQLPQQWLRSFKAQGKIPIGLRLL
ncbi:MAG: hypothetical protein IPP46_05880 [Bacteroidetes bacterium]|nr:hypothetical protein [Bacteroidota bacterium]